MSIDMHSEQAKHITIVTPLAFEAARLARGSKTDDWHVVISGPGRVGIESCVQDMDLPAGSVVLLAGTAGGLAPSLEQGDLVVASEIIGDGGERLTPPLQLSSASGVVCCVDRVLDSVQAKAQLHQQSGADAVDMESAPFGTLATARGWSWGVVRGISDNATTSLPAESRNWVDASGRTRMGSILGDLVRHPGLIFRLPVLRKHAGQAMASVHRGITELDVKTKS